MRVDRIKSLINENYPQAEYFGLDDESHMHSGRDGQESHFKLMLVCNSFAGKSRVQRQREIHSLLKPEFEAGLHALSLRLLTSEEYKNSGSEFTSPDCRGG